MPAATVREDSLLNRVQWNADAGIHLDLLGFVRFPIRHRGALHSHPFWELVFIGSGEGLLQSGTDVIPCGPEQILLVPPGAMHQFLAGDAPAFDQLYLGFSFDLALSEALARSLPSSLLLGSCADLIRSGLRESLRLLTERRDVGRDLDAIRGRLLAVAGGVVTLLLSGETGANPPRQRQYGSMVRKAEEYIQANLKNKLGVPDLARQFRLSPQYFGEIFKRETGRSIKAYLGHYRMLKAMELLRESGLTIAEIAEAVGLEDPAYFSRSFKKRYGLPPRRIRARAARA